MYPSSARVALPATAKELQNRGMPAPKSSSCKRSDVRLAIQVQPLMICTTQATAGSPLATSRLTRLNAAEDSPVPPHRRGSSNHHKPKRSRVERTSSVIDRCASPSGAFRRSRARFSRTAAIRSASTPVANEELSAPLFALLIRSPMRVGSLLVRIRGHRGLPPRSPTVYYWNVRIVSRAVHGIDGPFTAGKHRRTSPDYRASCRIKSAARQAVAIAGALVLPDIVVGMTEQSTTRSASTPRTRKRASTTAWGSLSSPILHVPTA